MRKASDNYPTPEPLARWITTEAIRLHPRPVHELSVFEPGCGDTAPFARAAAGAGAKQVKATDIRSVSEQVRKQRLGNSLRTFDYVDFLEAASWRQSRIYHRGFDIVLTNPPFSLALPFVELCLEMLRPDGVAAFLLRLGFLATLQRKPFFERHPPHEVVVLQRRPSFTGKGTDATEYGVFFWLGSRLQALAGPGPRLRWYENPRSEVVTPQQ